MMHMISVTKAIGQKSLHVVYIHIYIYIFRGGWSMCSVGAVAPTGILKFFFNTKVLKILTIVAPTENLKKNCNQNL